MNLQREKHAREKWHARLVVVRMCQQHVLERMFAEHAVTVELAAATITTGRGRCGRFAPSVSFYYTRRLAFRATDERPKRIRSLTHTHTQSGHNQMFFACNRNYRLKLQKNAPAVLCSFRRPQWPRYISVEKSRFPLHSGCKDVEHHNSQRAPNLPLITLLQRARPTTASKRKRPHRVLLRVFRALVGLFRRCGFSNLVHTTRPGGGLSRVSVVQQPGVVQPR